MGTRVKTDDRGTSSARFTFIGRNDGLNFNVITDKENRIVKEKEREDKGERERERGKEASLKNFTDFVGICRTISP